MANNLAPQPGPQTEFMKASADIVIFGGAAGGSKSYGLLLESLRHINVPNFTGIIFRRKSTELTNPGGLWQEVNGMARQLQPESSHPKARGKPSYELIYPSTAVMKFSHLEYEENLPDHQGGQYCFIGFDELTTFTKKMFFFLLTRNRSLCDVKPYIRATCNPDAASWVKDFIQWWIDPDTGLAIPERCGVVRYFTRDGDKIVWVDEKWRHPITGTPPKSITFIHASVDDNKILMKRDPGYKTNLLSADRVDVERFYHGNWNIRNEDGMFSVKNFKTIKANDVPKDLNWFRYWDRAATEKTEKNQNPDNTAGALGAVGADGALYIKDMKKFRKNSAENETTIKETAMADGRDVTIGIEQEPGSSGKDVCYHYKTTVLKDFVVREDRPSGDKVDRCKPWCALSWHGKVYLVEGPWITDFLAEIELFPPQNKSVKKDQCFVAGTKIKTPFGDKNIESLNVGDSVFTPFGIRKIVKTYENKSEDIITKANLTGTSNHPVFVESAGFIKMDSLTGSDKYSIFTIKEVLSWRLKNLLSSTGSSTKGLKTLHIIISQSSRKTVGRLLRDCMSQFGNFIIKGKFLKAMLFTTKILTHLIMTPITLSVCRGMNMLNNLLESVLINSENILMKFATLLSGGTVLLKELNGTSNTGEKLRKDVEKLRHRVLFVDMYSNAIKEKRLSSALTIAATNIDGETIRNSSKNTASGVALSMMQDCLKENLETIAQESAYVLTPGRISRPVYNIEVEDDHVYYANGVLVKNCDAVSGLYKLCTEDRYVCPDYGIRNRQSFAVSLKAMNAFRFCTMFQEKDMSIYGVCMLWNYTERKLYVYDEFHEPAPNKSAIIGHINKKAKGATIYGNPPMFTEGENIAHIITMSGNMVNKNGNADDGGSLLVMNEMIKREQLIVHPDCYETDRQYREWMKENDRPSDINVGMVKGVMMVITELREQNQIVAPVEPGPYSKEKQRRRDAIRGGRQMGHIPSGRGPSVNKSGRWMM